jgi:hypothetical protein
VNRFFFRVNDFQFSPEACNFSGGFLTLEHFFDYPPLEGSGILSVQAYAKTINEGMQVNGLTPMQVAENLDAMAEKTLAALPGLRSEAAGNKELLATITDLEAIAYLGRYYADKIRAAADLAVFRANAKQTNYHRRAVNHLNNAVADWEIYAKISTGQYREQLFSRTDYMDWWSTLEEVKKEVETVKAEAK